MNTLDTGEVLAALGDAVIVADRDEKIRFWNPAAARLFGFDAAEALGQPLSLITPERLRQRHSTGFSRSMETGTTRYGTQLLKVPAVHKDGHPLSIAFTVAMLFDPQRQVTGVVAVIRDETARYREDRELKQRLAELQVQSAARP